MATEKDVAAQKSRAEKAEAEVKKLQTRVVTLENRIKVFDLDDISDEDLKSVKTLLLESSQELDSREADIEKREKVANDLEATHEKREKDSLIQSLASKYMPKSNGEDKEKALKDFTAKLKDAEDPEKEALRLYVEGLSGSSGEEGTTTPAEEVHDHVPAGGKLKKSPLEMNDQELKEFEAEHSAVKT